MTVCNEIQSCDNETYHCKLPIVLDRYCTEYVQCTGLNVFNIKWAHKYCSARGHGNCSITCTCV